MQMSDYLTNDLMPVSDAFDHDYSNTFDSPAPIDGNPLTATPIGSDNNFASMQDVIQYDDPLKYASTVKYTPLDFHFVEPHYVNGYLRSDGTYVEGYYRDGDGDTTVDRTEENGGGYFRGDPEF